MTSPQELSADAQQPRMCGDGRECASSCGSGPCSRVCQACGRLAWTKTRPCPACPDFSQLVLLPSGVTESPAASVLPESVLSPADRQVLQEAVNLLHDKLPRHQPQQVSAVQDEPGRQWVLCSCGESYSRPATGPDLAREAARLAHVMKAELGPKERGT